MVQRSMIGSSATGFVTTGRASPAAAALNDRLHQNDANAVAPIARSAIPTSNWNGLTCQPTIRRRDGWDNEDGTRLPTVLSRPRAAAGATTGTVQALTRGHGAGWPPEAPSSEGRREGCEARSLSTRRSRRTAGIQIGYGYRSPGQIGNEVLSKRVRKSGRRRYLCGRGQRSPSTASGRLSSSPSSRRRIERLLGLLFRFLRPCTGAKQMTKRRQNLYMIAHDFRDRQQRRREQRAWYAPQPVPEH